MALFAVAPWVGGEVYAAFDEKVPRHIPLPDRPIRSMLANPNYQVILALLLRPVKKDAGTGVPGWVSREYLFRQLWSVYVPSRKKSVKAGCCPGKGGNLYPRPETRRRTDARDILRLHESAL